MAGVKQITTEGRMKKVVQQGEKSLSESRNVSSLLDESLNENDDELSLQERSERSAPRVINKEKNGELNF